MAESGSENSRKISSPPILELRNVTVVRGERKILSSVLNMRLILAEGGTQWKRKQE